MKQPKQPKKLPKLTDQDYAVYSALATMLSQYGVDFSVGATQLDLELAMRYVEKRFKPFFDGGSKTYGLRMVRKTCMDLMERIIAEAKEDKRNEANQSKATDE